MGKGQRAKKEQASLAAAALLAPTAKKAPSQLAMENQKILSPHASSFMPSRIVSPLAAPSPPLPSSTPSPSAISLKEDQEYDPTKVINFYQNNLSTRLTILNNYFMALAEDFSQLRIDETIPVEFHQTSFNAYDLTQIIQRSGLCSPEGSLIICSIINSLQGDFSNPTLGMLGRGIDFAVSLKVLSSLQSPDSLDRESEAIVIAVLPALLKFHNHKNNRIRDLAGQICKSFASVMVPQVQPLIFPILMTHIQPEEDWKIRVAALDILYQLSKVAKQQLSPLLPIIIPAVSDCMKDSKKQLSSVATETMLFSCSFINNDDISHLVPQLVSVISHPEESPRTLDKLLETTFVATVDGPTLALITPLLAKSLKERSSVTKRKASKVIENMCKLVQNPADVHPFVPLLLPSLDKTIDEVVDEEVCEVARGAREVLVRAMGESVVSDDPIPAFSSALTQNIFLLISNNILKFKEDHSIPPSILTPSEVIIRNILSHHIASQLAALILYSSKAFTPLQIATNIIPSGTEICADVWNFAVASTSTKLWNECIEPHITSLLSHFFSQQDAANQSDSVVLNPSHEFSSNLRVLALKGNPDIHEDNDNNMEDYLCNFEFSLAYGGKILLQNTKLKLVRGRRYGIMGKNGVGKTTLMTNIGSGNIDGLPNSLRTVYVQHDDHSYVAPELSILDELMSYPLLLASVDEAIATLTEVGFTDEMLSSSRLTLSGGWKMKLLIVRAILSKADILLLDEPTNHLDTASVQWLVDYLSSQSHLTCLIVSHDPQFLDQVITDVIHYEQKQLVYYPGSLKDFVSLHPEAKYYYQLETSTMKFVFPNPERLDGVNSLTRAIMKMDNATFTYPGASRPSLSDCSVKLTLGSRVGVTGVNGAGKSTLIKLLVQEVSPDVNGKIPSPTFITHSIL
jgi:elongation factor 3